jgi:hypothetical protein
MSARARDDAAIAEALAELATGQGEYGARKEVEPDEQAYLRIAQGKISDEERGDGRDGLELHRHADPGQEDESQREPAAPEQGSLHFWNVDSIMATLGLGRSERRRSRHRRQPWPATSLDS